MSLSRLVPSLLQCSVNPQAVITGSKREAKTAALPTPGYALGLRVLPTPHLGAFGAAGGRLDSFHRHNAIQLQTTPQTRRPDRCQDRDTQGCVQSADYPPLKDGRSEAQGSEVTCLRSHS